MTSKNEITGDDIKSKINSDDYREGWERIFGKRPIKTLSDYINLVQELEEDSNKKDSDKLE